MTPCSAWCRPDEGVHVFLGSTRNLRGGVPTVEGVRRRVMAEPVNVSTGIHCVPEWTVMRTLSIDPASEVPESPDPSAIRYLVTVQVVDDHRHHVHVPVAS